MRARMLDGRRLRVAAFLTPMLERYPERVLISENSVLPCQICGSVHDAGAQMFVEPRTPPDQRLALHRAIAVIGQLTVRKEPSGALQVYLLDGVFSEPASVLPVEARRSRDTRGDSARINKTQATLRRRQTQRGSHGGGNGAADTVLTNGKFHTVCEALGTVDAVAIRDGRFVAVGSAEAVNRHIGAQTQLVDLDGKIAIPGLIDSHLHQITLAFNMPAVDLMSARSIADLQTLIGERAAVTEDGDWVVTSSGWHESMLTEGRMPTRRELDEVSPRNPVMVPRGGHVVAANSLALQAAGITDDTPDPNGGVIVRDAGSGAATGVLLEAAAYFVRKVAPGRPARERLGELLVQAMQLLNSYGIVSVIDPIVDEHIIEIYKSLREQGRMTVRTDVLYKVRDLEQTRKGIEVVQAQRSDSMLRFPGIKFMLDGGVEGARLQQPYRIVAGEQPRDDYHGLYLLPSGGADELIAAYELIAAAGLQAQTHAVGDATIELVADCYAAVAEALPVRDLNWCLLHAFLPSGTAIAKLKAAGIVVAVQDHPVLLGHNQRRWWGEERAAASIPIRRLIDAGLLVGAGTDGPVVPVDPFLCMWWMTTRQTLNGDVLGSEQAISASEALQLYTLNNARILGVADERGSIEVGKYADLTILSQDILAIDPDRIRATRALLTMVGGEVVFQHGANSPHPQPFSPRRRE